jgi:hypothetical protein
MDGSSWLYSHNYVRQVNTCVVIFFYKFLGYSANNRALWWLVDLALHNSYWIGAVTINPCRHLIIMTS